jgi:hypothetical protein
MKKLLANFSLGGRDKLTEFGLVVGRPKAFNPPLKVLNRFRRKDSQRNLSNMQNRNLSSDFLDNQFQYPISSTAAIDQTQDKNHYQ